MECSWNSRLLWHCVNTDRGDRVDQRDTHARTEREGETEREREREIEIEAAAAFLQPPREISGCSNLPSHTGDIKICQYIFLVLPTKPPVKEESYTGFFRRQQKRIPRNANLALRASRAISTGAALNGLKALHFP